MLVHDMKQIPNIQSLFETFFYVKYVKWNTKESYAYIYLYDIAFLATVNDMKNS
jgi:hypothetical protein